MKKVFAVLFTILAVVGIAQIGGDRKRLSEQGPAQMNSQALCDCPFIPLAGTEVGSPVTGPIEFELNYGTSYLHTTSGGLALYAEDGSNTGQIVAAQSEVLMEATDDNYGGNIYVRPSGVVMFSSNVNSDGITYGADYSNSYTDYSLTHKAWSMPIVGSGPPTITPDRIGKHYTDTTGLVIYEAACTTSLSCWVQISN